MVCKYAPHAATIIGTWSRGFLIAGVKSGQRGCSNLPFSDWGRQLQGFEMSRVFKDRNGKERTFKKFGWIGKGPDKYPATSGVYIMAREGHPIYIGQSEDLHKWLVPGHPKAECAANAGADAIYILEAPKAETEKIVQDLVYAYNPECNGAGK